MQLSDSRFSAARFSNQKSQILFVLIGFFSKIKNFKTYWSNHKQGRRRVKKWFAQRRSKPGLFIDSIFHVATACLSLSVE